MDIKSKIKLTRLACWIPILFPYFTVIWYKSQEGQLHGYCSPHFVSPAKPVINLPPSHWVVFRPTILVKYNPFCFWWLLGYFTATTEASAAPSELKMNIYDKRRKQQGIHIQSTNTFCQIVWIHFQLPSKCCWKILKSILPIQLFWTRAFNAKHCVKKTSLCYFLRSKYCLQNLPFNYLWDLQYWFGRSLPVFITAGKWKNSLIKTGKHNCSLQITTSAGDFTCCWKVETSLQYKKILN